jgi:phage baseplate assembly protein W
MPIYQAMNGSFPTTRPLLYEVEAIYESLFNIFNTRPGERPFQPEFGLEIEEELFELVDNVSAFAILDKIIKAVTRWESRVTLNLAGTMVTAYPDDNKFDVVIYFRVNGLSGDSFEYRGSFVK